MQLTGCWLKAESLCFQERPMESVESLTENIVDRLDFSDLNYKNFLENNAKAFEAINLVVPDRDLIATQKAIHAIGAFIKNGKPIFQVTKNLTQALVQTDPPNFPLSEFKAPFPAFRIEPSPGIVKFANQPADKIYVTFVEGDRFQVLIVFEKQIHYMAFPLSDTTKTLEEAVNITRENMWKDLPEETRKRLQAEAEYFGIDDYFDQSAFKFAVNLVLYATSIRRDVEPLDKRIVKQHGKQSPRDGIRKIYICGRKFTIEREITANFTREGRKIMKRFMVRGHWKMQPYGKNSELRKHIFVAPYWKGPEFAELVARNYVVS